MELRKIGEILTTPLPACRHWESKYADEAINKGRIRLMPAVYYADIEQQKLRDELECAVKGRLSFFDSKTAENCDHILKEAARHGLDLTDISSETNIVISNMSAILSVEPRYIWCMSKDNTLGKFDEPGAPAKNVVTYVPDVRVCRQLSQTYAPARNTAPRKFLAVLSYLVAMALNCLSFRKKFSTR